MRAVAWAAVLIALFRADLRAQCVFSAGGGVTSAASVGVSSGSSGISSAISGAAGIWNNCGSAGIPAVVANGSGSLNVEVTYVPGQSTRDDGACGQGAPTVGSNGNVTGGSITVWQQWGPGSTAPTAPPGTDCGAHFAGIIAHELGHVFGLQNSGCSGYIMGTGAWESMTSANPEECSAVDAKWSTPTEETNEGGCQGRLLNIADDCSPIIVNFDRGPYQLTGPTDPVWFDFDGSGSSVAITWTAAGADHGFLWTDRNGNGVVDSGRELFGNATILTSGRRAANGFEALEEFDLDSNSLIDARDPIWDKLMLWRDYNHDGVSQPGEVEPVARSIMSAVSLRYHWTGHRDRFGNTFRYQSTVWLDIGHGRDRARESRPVYDIFFVRVH